MPLSMRRRVQELVRKAAEKAGATIERIVADDAGWPGDVPTTSVAADQKKTSGSKTCEVPPAALIRDGPARHNVPPTHQICRRNSMLKTIALVDFAVSLALAPVAAVAQDADRIRHLRPATRYVNLPSRVERVPREKNYTYETARAVRHHYYAPRYHGYYPHDRSVHCGFDEPRAAEKR